jgi:hypothetical protein
MLFGIDIGGTLAKIVFREPESPHRGPMAEQIARLNKYFMSQDLFPDTGERVHKSSSMPILPVPASSASSSPSASPAAGAQERGGEGEGEGEGEDAKKGTRKGAEDENLYIDDASYGGVFGGNLRFRRLETSQVREYVLPWLEHMLH